MAKYYCRQCYTHNGELLCTGCLQFVCEDPALVDAYLVDKALLPDLPASGHVGCTVVVAHWGDSMVALAYTKAVLDRLGQQQCDALYYGPDVRIAELIAAQPWIGKVHSAPPGANYSPFVQNAINRIAPASDWLEWVRADIPDLPAELDLFSDGIANYWAVRQRRVLPIRFDVPAERTDWALKFLDGIQQDHGLAQPPVFLHPSSTWSAGQQMHWPHWPALIDWLLENTDQSFLVTGMNSLEWLPRTPRIINAVGQIPTNLENLALAQLCGRAVTTCNSVALWAASQGFPAFILGNQAIGGHINPFRRYFERSPNIYVPVEAPLSWAVERLAPFFGQQG